MQNRLRDIGCSNSMMTGACMIPVSRQEKAGWVYEEGRSGDSL